MSSGSASSRSCTRRCRWGTNSLISSSAMSLLRKWPGERLPGEHQFGPRPCQYCQGCQADAERLGWAAGSSVVAQPPRAEFGWFDVHDDSGQGRAWGTVQSVEAEPVVPGHVLARAANVEALLPDPFGGISYGLAVLDAERSWMRQDPRVDLRRVSAGRNPLNPQVLRPRIAPQEWITPRDDPLVERQPELPRAQQLAEHHRQFVARVVHLGPESGNDAILTGRAKHRDGVPTGRQIRGEQPGRESLRLIQPPCPGAARVGQHQTLRSLVGGQPAPGDDLVEQAKRCPDGTPRGPSGDVEPRSSVRAASQRRSDHVLQNGVAVMRDCQP